MTYHADLAPSRRPWLIATPLAVVVALAAAWTALWFYASSEAEVRLNDWRAQQARSGRVFNCASQTVGGAKKELIRSRAISRAPASRMASSR